MGVHFGPGGGFWIGVHFGQRGWVLGGSSFLTGGGFWMGVHFRPGGCMLSWFNHETWYSGHCRLVVSVWRCVYSIVESVQLPYMWSVVSVGR